MTAIAPHIAAFLRERLPRLSMALKTRTYLAHTAGNRQRGW